MANEILWLAVEHANEEECILDPRNELVDRLEALGFREFEATGGQAAFEDGDEALFLAAVKEWAEQNGRTVQAKRCPDPGLGLF